MATAVIDRLGAGTAVAMGTALGAVAEQRDGGGGGGGGGFGAFWGLLGGFQGVWRIWGNLGRFWPILIHWREFGAQKCEFWG